MPVERGLSSKEAAHLLLTDGPNEIPGADSRNALTILLSALREPMLILLVCCASIYFFMGELRDGAILSFSVFIVIGLTIYQELKSEKAIEALRDLSSPRALVIRDGNEIRISGREVVTGDLLIIAEGDRVAADAVLMSSQNLKVDESLLTGESFSVSKNTSQENRLFSGTLVVAGRGTGKVTATGAKTQMGRIGQSLQERKSEDQTLLQKELGKLIRIFGLIGISFSLLIVVIYGLTRGNWTQGLLVGLASAMSLLPEEFPVVLTVFLAMGAWRISKAQVLTRKISATESLGSITVLCVDKTGTLTKNQMEVKVLDAEDRLALLEWSALASQPHPFDPMEKAIQLSFEKESPEAHQKRKDWQLIREYPLSPQLLAVTYVLQSPDLNHLKVACKGAPEAVIGLCRLPEAVKRDVLKRVQALAEQGLRVLGVAKSVHGGTLLPEHPQDFQFEWIGLIALEDPVRPEVPQAMRECYEAGIRVMMMTGDYIGTARSIAKQIGFANPDQVITGAELQKLSDTELRERIKTTDVFARMVPEQKLRVIHALKANSEIVAMTGDGVNDAPSLKWADVGIAMGGRGTDVAREAASIVLLDDNFASIVAAIRLGRRIFDNIRKAMAYIFAVHVPIAGMAMLPVLLNLPLVLLPAHIVFLELVIDPACALIFEMEAAEGNVMRRPPRSLGKPLFGILEIARNLAQGTVALIFVFGAYWYTLAQTHDENITRAVTFASLVLSNLGLILVNRSRSAPLLETLRIKNRAFAWLVSGAILLLALVLYLPFTQAVFGFGTINVRGISIALMSAFLTLVFGQLLRHIWKEEPA